MKNETAHKALDTFLDAVALPFKAATDFLDQTTATMKPGLGFGVPSLRAVRFQPGHPENTEMSGAHFAILGEFGNTQALPPALRRHWRDLARNVPYRPVGSDPRG